MKLSTTIKPTSWSQARNGSILVGLIYKDWILCHEYDQGHYPLHDHDYDHDLGHDLYYLQDIDSSKGLERDDGYDDYDENIMCGCVCVSVCVSTIVNKPTKFILAWNIEFMTILLRLLRHNSHIFQPHNIQSWNILTMVILPSLQVCP